MAWIRGPGNDYRPMLRRYSREMRARSRGRLIHQSSPVADHPAVELNVVEGVEDGGNAGKQVPRRRR